MGSRARLRHVALDSVIAEYEAGTAVRAICERHRIGWSTLYRILDDHHVPRREPEHASPIPEAIQDEIAAAYQRGEPVAAIAERFGVSKGTVSNVGRRRCAQRVHMRRHDDLVALVVRWFFDDDLNETELDAIHRVGVVTRRSGFGAIAQLAPELRAAVIEQLSSGLRQRWPQAPTAGSAPR